MQQCRRVEHPQHQFPSQPWPSCHPFPLRRLFPSLHLSPLRRLSPSHHLFPSRLQLYRSGRHCLGAELLGLLSPFLCRRLQQEGREVARLDRSEPKFGSKISIGFSVVRETWSSLLRLEVGRFQNPWPLHPLHLCPSHIYLSHLCPSLLAAPVHLLVEEEVLLGEGDTVSVIRVDRLQKSIERKCWCGSKF